MLQNIIPSVPSSKRGKEVKLETPRGSRLMLLMENSTPMDWTMTPIVAENRQVAYSLGMDRGLCGSAF